MISFNLIDDLNGTDGQHQFFGFICSHKSYGRVDGDISKRMHNDGVYKAFIGKENSDNFPQLPFPVFLFCCWQCFSNFEILNLLYIFNIRHFVLFPFPNDPCDQLLLSFTLLCGQYYITKYENSKYKSEVDKKTSTRGRPSCWFNFVVLKIKGETLKGLSQSGTNEMPFAGERDLCGKIIC